ncbi:MAG TPA: NADPH-dependent FMN reductase [Solirubrobacterales bacterium]|nr:NADPH-dependent FMN reductase [Solirubrobacterales bacterium]
MPSAAEDLIALTAVVGSVTPPGRLRHAVAGALDRADAAGTVTPTLLDLAELEIAFADGRPAAELDDDTAATVVAIDRADAVLLATPVYRGSLTGALKNLLDHVPVEALEGKACAIVAMGASLHHFLGADRHLRDILTFYGAVPTPVAAYLTAGDFEEGEARARPAAELDLLLADTVELARALARRESAQGLRPLVARPRS